MKLTLRTEYGLLALVFLARRKSRDENVSVATIAKAQDIPAKFLEQIMLVLKRGGFLRSRKGKGGGFRLARDPKAISLAEVIRLFDGALAPTESVSKYFYEPTPLQKEKKILAVMQEIRDWVADKLEGTTLADIV